MFIYNITFNIEESIQHDWLSWMNNFFKELSVTGNFTAATIHQVIVKEEMGGLTFAVHFETPTKESLNQFQLHDLTVLQNQMQQHFSGKFVYFQTELKVINQFHP